MESIFFDRTPDQSQSHSVMQNNNQLNIITSYAVLLRI